MTKRELWHFFPRFAGTMTASLPLSSALGIVSTFALGIMLGYLHERTGNIVAPWLVHAVAGVALVMMGTMSFIQYVQ